MKDRVASSNRLASRHFRPAAAMVGFTFDGRPVHGIEGESLAAALTATGIRGLRRTRTGAPRGYFCGMGICYECLVTVDGRAGQRACMTNLESGMQVGSQPHAFRIPADAGRPLAEAPEGEIPVRDCEVLVVGAGPGGLAAAEAAAQAGAAVTVLDERLEPGGQYFKQLAPSQRFTRASAMDRQFARGQALIQRVRETGVDMVSGATVWNAGDDGRDGGVALDVLRDGRAWRYRTARLIVATGAYERAYPVSGWTLPGFMTTGAAQILGRTYRVAPGSRVLIAGNGPLNLQVAGELARGGCRVVAVAEAAPRPGAARLGAALEALRRAPDLIRDGLSYLASLKRFGVPVFYGHVLTGADGGDRVEAATLAPIDADGRPVAASERRFEVDAICTGYGFLPSTEITRLLGCKHRHDDGGSGALVVERDKNCMTSRAGVFAVGDCGGIGGARVAQSQGTLAGYAAARDLGRDLTAEAEARAKVARRALTRDLAFQAALWRLFEAPAISCFFDDRVPICRCEDVTAATLESFIDQGVDEIGALKRLTRAGMGRCQGRYCGVHIAEYCAYVTGRPQDEFALFAPRFPVQPIPAVAVIREQPEWSEVDQGVPPPVSVRTGLGIETERRADIVVIGAGIIGTCAAYYLAKEGLDVVLLDRGEPNGEASGANAGSLHVQLLSYDFGELAQAGGRPAAETLPLQLESARLWPTLAEDLERDLEIAITGGLMLAEDDHGIGLLRRKVELEATYGIPVEMVSASELRDLAPAVSERFVGAARCPEEGKINPMLATPAVLDGALGAGVRLFKQTEVVNIEAGPHGFLIVTNRGDFRAGKVANACGGWASHVAGMVGLKLPTRANPMQLIVTEPAPPLVGPLLAHVDRHLTLKQVANGNLVIGGGWRAALDSRTLRPRVLRDSFAGNLWVAHRVVPALRHLHVIRSWAAMNVAIDGAPILGEAPGVPGFYNAVAVNGVTLGPLIGRLTAEMMRTGRTRPELAGFTLARFG